MCALRTDLLVTEKVKFNRGRRYCTIEHRILPRSSMSNPTREDHYSRWNKHLTYRIEGPLRTALRLRTSG